MLQRSLKRKKPAQDPLLTPFCLAFNKALAVFKKVIDNPQSGRCFS
jgi:hypothetical protein